MPLKLTLLTCKLPGAERAVCLMPDGRKIRISLAPRRPFHEGLEYRAVYIDAPADVLISRESVPPEEQAAG